MTHKLLFIVGAFLSLAAVTTPAQTTNGVLASLGAYKIYKQQVEDLVKLASEDGAVISPELRQQITNELIVREVINQDAKKTGLLTKNNNALKLKIVEQNAIVDLWFAQYFKSHPITEQDIRSEYDKQLALSKEPQNANEYEIAQISVGSESEASELIRKINAGSAFDALAKQYSLDKSTSQKGGIVGWTLSGNLIPPINDIVPNLSKGTVSSRPIRVGSNYYVIKLINIRPFKLPSYEEAQNRIAQQLIQNEREKAIAELLKSANFKVGP
jgi:peptidyl-prolyl cis-trans isomerase C